MKPTPVKVRRKFDETFKREARCWRGATTAAHGGLSTGTATVANVSARNGAAVVTAGLATAAGAAAATTAIGGAAWHGGQGISLISSPAFQNDRQTARLGSDNDEPPRFAKDDLTGIKRRKP